MPNWRERSEYEYIDQLTNHQKAWEYLRRSPDYRDDWNGYYSLPAKDKGYAMSHSLAKGWHLEQMVDPLDDHPQLLWITRVGPEIVTRANKR